MKRIAAALSLLISPLIAGEFPWSDSVPADVAASALYPDTVLDEIPCDWRPVLTPVVKPLVRDCGSAREAVLRIAGGLSKVTGVYYTPARRKHNMNALEALAEKKVSCTGQSILLVCALRSVGIPARAVGVLTWNHIRGNHTWAEAWFDGEWHMIEYNEKAFNTSWVMENIGMLNTSRPAQRIRAANPRGAVWWFPLPLYQAPNFRADDVTERYQKLAECWYAENGVPADSQRLLIDMQPRRQTPLIIELLDEAKNVISAAKLPALTDDIRYFTRLTVPRKGQHFLRIQGSATLRPVSVTSGPVQIVRLR